MQLSRRQVLQALSAASASLFLRPLSGPAGASTMAESRAIFDEGLNWASKSSAEIVCERIASAGFNVFMPCVWHGRGTIWPSDLAPWDSAASKIPGFDPLAHLLHVASRYNIEVHPWFTVVRRDREFFPSFYDESSVPETFDVHRPAFRDFIVSLISEVVQRYPIHGINLDYIRAGGICTSPYCVGLYKKETGRNLRQDVLGQYPNEFLAWQERAVTDIVKRVSVAAKEVNAQIVMSVDAVPGNFVDFSQGRNSIKWVDDGLVDVVYMMHYEANPDWTALRGLRRSMKRPEALVVLCGNYEDIQTSSGRSVVPRDAGKVAELLSEARQYQQGNGLGLYLYSRLSDQQIAELKAQTFRERAMPSWKRGGRSPASPQGLDVR